jgi:predicted dehydrogenase
MADPLRIGLIGCGGIVQQSHVPGLLEIPELVQIGAVADPVEANRDRIGQTCGVPVERRFDDYRDLLGAGDLDAVIIATPHSLHAEQAIQAASAGLGIVSEKPMATSLDDADAVLEAVGRSGVIYTVVHNFLYMPGTLEACRLLAAGEIDTPLVGSAKSLFPKTADQADPQAVWRASAAAGGGCIGDTGYHEIYLVETLVGSPVRYVEARVQTKFFDVEVDDVALLLLEHQNGAVSTVSTSWGVAGGGAGETGNLCEVHGRGDSLRVVARGRELHRFERAARQWHQVELPGLDPATLGRAGHAAYFKDTFSALARGEDLRVDGKAARHNLAIIEAARRASQQRRAVDVDTL